MCWLYGPRPRRERSSCTPCPDAAVSQFFLDSLRPYHKHSRLSLYHLLSTGANQKRGNAIGLPFPRARRAVFSSFRLIFLRFDFSSAPGILELTSAAQVGLKAKIPTGVMIVVLYIKRCPRALPTRGIRSRSLRKAPPSSNLS